MQNAVEIASEDFRTARISSKSTFQDNIWVLDGYAAGQGQKIIYWDAFAFGDGCKITDPRHERLLISCKTFLLLCAKGRVSRGNRAPRSSMVHNLAFNLRQFVTWMIVHKVELFQDITEEHIVTYRNYVQRRKARKMGKGRRFVSTDAQLSPHSQFTAKLVVAHLIRLRSEVPWGCSLSSNRVHDLLWAGQKYGSKKRTERIPDATFVPLVEKAIWWIREVAPKVLARASVFEDFRRTHKAGQNWQYDDIYERSYPEAIVEIHGSRHDVNRMRATELNTWVICTVAACFIVIAGHTGMRASEVLSLRQGCLKRASRGGRTMLFLSGTLYKTSDESNGEPAEWVAGWDEDANPVRMAVHVLMRINDPGDTEGARLFCSPAARDNAATYSRASVQGNINRFARLVGIADWAFTPHQFRKTFARFVALAAPNAAIALMRHFKHVSIQMTERYFPNDPELMDEIMDATLELVAEKVDGILGAEKLAGVRGAEILARNSQFRGREGAAARKRMVQMTMLDPGARILLHVYGLCIYDEATAKCKGHFESVGLNICAQCPNLVIAEEHLPFWEEQERALTATIDELSTQGGISVELERQRERARENIRRLKDGHAERPA